MWEFPGLCFRTAGVVSGIHEWGYFQLGGGTGMKLGRMMGVSGANILCKDVHLSGCLYTRHVKGTIVWALLLEVPAFTGTGMLFFCRGVLRG